MLPICSSERLILNSIGLSLILLLVFNPYMSTLSLWLPLSRYARYDVLLGPLSRALDRLIANVKQNIFTTAYKSVSSHSCELSGNGKIIACLCRQPADRLNSIRAFKSASFMVTVGSVCMTSGGLGALFMLIKLDIIENRLFCYRELRRNISRKQLLKYRNFTTLCYR